MSREKINNLRERLEEAETVWRAEVGRRIKKARIAVGMTQFDLAARVDLSRPQVTNIEKGATLTTLTHFTAICETLAVSSDTLLGLSDITI